MGPVGPLERHCLPILSSSHSLSSPLLLLIKLPPLILADIFNYKRKFRMLREAPIPPLGFPQPPLPRIVDGYLFRFILPRSVCRKQSTPPQKEKTRSPQSSSSSSHYIHFVCPLTVRGETLVLPLPPPTERKCKFRTFFFFSVLSSLPSVRISFPHSTTIHSEGEEAVALFKLKLGEAFSRN